MKKFLLLLLSAVVIVTIAGVVYLSVFLPNIPLKDIQIERTEARIKRGEYLANHVTVCMDCHGTRDWTKFSGPMKPENLGKGGETFTKQFGFPGTFISANLTPFGLESWTDAEIYRAITSGVKKDGSVIFPVMPILRYQHLATEDVYSIIAYLRSLKPIEFTPEKSEIDFPVNLIMNTFPKEATPMEIPSKDDFLAYGKYMTNASGCVECHTPFENNALVMEKAFSGGREFPFNGGTMYSKNLTPDKETGSGNWTKEFFVERFKTFDPKEGYQNMDAAPGTFNTIMPWTMYAGMDTTDLEAIFTYLQSLDPIKNATVSWVPNEK